MWDAAGDVAAALERLLAGLTGAVSAAAPGWLALGVGLHLGNQVARGRGWYAILRRACDGDPCLRRRDAILAWMAGAGAGGVVSGRGGDAVRVLLLVRRLPQAGCPRLAGTLVAEAAGECALGVLVLAIALLAGAGPERGTVAWGAAVAAAVAGAGLALARVRRLRSAAAILLRPRVGRVFAGLRQGCVALGEPGAYLRGVTPWQLASRACRAAALACFLAAFGLPATPLAVLLVMFAQGAGRLVPLSPAAVGAQAAVLAAMFGPVTGAAVPAGRAAAFLVGTSTVLTAVGTVLALAIALRGAEWRALAVAVRAVRPAPAAAGPPARPR